MPFVDTNSHLTTKPSNFDIKCHSNSKSYDRHGFFGTKFKGSQNFFIYGGRFFNEREYSRADWLDLLIVGQVVLNLHMTNSSDLVFGSDIVLPVY